MQEYINAKVLLEGRLVQKDFLIEDGRIYFNYKKTKNSIDLSGKIVSPGFVDIHVHTRVPGFEHKEDIAHLDEAALIGGFTQVVAMGNIDPAPTDVDNHEIIQSLLNRSKINIMQCARVSDKNKLVDIVKMSECTKIFSDDGLPIDSDSLMKNALKLIKKTDSLILLHEEDHNLKGYGYHSNFAKLNHIKTFGSEYETNIVERDIRMNKDIQAKMHLQHISCKETIEMLKEQKGKMDISAELTPHHLFFSNEDINGSTNFKMNPPLNSKEHQEALIQAFKDEVVDIIATDHAPHAEHEKNVEWKKAANGIIGLESAFAAVNTVIGFEHIEKTLRAMTINPAKRIGLDVEIKEGQYANIVIIDPHEKWIFTEEDIRSKSKNSPWINVELTGRVKEVIWTKI